MNNKILENELDYLPVDIIKIISHYKEIFETNERYNKSIKLMKEYKFNEFFHNEDLNSGFICTYYHRDKLFFDIISECIIFAKPMEEENIFLKNIKLFNSLKDKKNLKLLYSDNTIICKKCHSYIYN